MADRSHIEWTDATWNPITGCSVVSPGCTNCYAMRLAGTRLRNHPSRVGMTRPSKAGPVWTGVVRFNEQWLDQPLRWRKPRRIFVGAHTDLFHENVPDDWLDRVCAVMSMAPQHKFQILTKRSARMKVYALSRFGGACNTYISDAGMEINHTVSEDDQQDAADWTDLGKPLPNVHMYVSCEDQERADERILELLATPAAVRGVSLEPLLGPIDIKPWISRIDHVIVGGESGPNARPMHPDWVRSLRDQCMAAGVPFFFKQWGEWIPFTRDHYGRLTSRDDWAWVTIDGRAEIGPVYMSHDPGNENVCGMARVGKKRAGRVLDGREWNEQP